MHQQRETSCDGSSVEIKQNEGIGRRSFLQAGVAAIGVSALSYGRILGANDRISLGHAGVGRRGRELAAVVAELRDSHNVEMTAVCDLWKENRERAEKAAEHVYGRAPRTVMCFEDLLDYSPAGGYPQLSAEYVLAAESGICSTDILVFRATEKCCPEYLCLLTHTDEFVEHAKATTSGVQHPRTSWAALRDFKLHVPPRADQRQIAAVLGIVRRAFAADRRLHGIVQSDRRDLWRRR